MPADLKRSWTGAEAEPDTRMTVARTLRASQGQARWSCVPLGLGEGGSVLWLHGAMVRGHGPRQPKSGSAAHGR